MRFTVAILLLAIFTWAPAQAGSFARSVSDINPYAVGFGVILPALTDHDKGKETTIRYLDAQVAAGAVTQLLKHTIHERRPDGSDTLSFPSGHTSSAFALAGALSKTHPKQKWLYIGLAAVVGWSRVELDKHHWHDVAAGAVIGYTAGQWAVTTKRGILIGRVFKF